jgi:hypothetical protein
VQIGLKQHSTISKGEKNNKLPNTHQTRPQYSGNKSKKPPLQTSPAYSKQNRPSSSPKTTKQRKTKSKAKEVAAHNQNPRTKQPKIIYSCKHRDPKPTHTRGKSLPQLYSKTIAMCNNPFFKGQKMH